MGLVVPIIVNVRLFHILQIKSVMLCCVRLYKFIHNGFYYDLKLEQFLIIFESVDIDYNKRVWKNRDSGISF